MYAQEIRLAAEASPRAALPEVTKALWRAFGEGYVTEAEAEALSALIEARQRFGIERRAERNRNPTGTGSPDAAQDLQGRPRTGVGTRPRTDASLERRRRWAASGRIPPALASRFTPGEQAVLSLVAAETARRGDCRLSVPHLAAVAGVAETTVRKAIREARNLGLLTVEERRLTGFRNDTNVVRIVSPEWAAWLRLGRKGDSARSAPARRTARHASRHEGGGCGIANRTPTEVLGRGKTRKGKGPRAQSAGPGAPSGGGSRIANA